MKKVFLVFALILMLTGCSSQRVEPLSIENSYAEPVARPTTPEPMPTPGANRGAPSRRSPRSASEATTEPQVHNAPSMPGPAPMPNPTPPSNSTGSYQTEFDTSDTARGANIALAAESINNTVIQPGETFSFNDTVGSTTGERGYKKAVIFVDGKKSKGYGGGVCQVSTTLCNAAVSAGMTIIERHDHSRPVAYVGDGLQAATSHNGNIDFKFKNDTPHPVVIYAKAENGVVFTVVSSQGEN